MSKFLEQIIVDQQVLAMIVRSRFSVSSEVHFFTQPEDSLQVALHDRAKNTIIKAHLDECLPRSIDVIQEILYLIEGKVEVDFFSNEGKLLETQVLEKGDTLIQMSGGHGFRMIEAARFLEIKQGPYLDITRKYLSP